MHLVFFYCGVDKILRFTSTVYFHRYAILHLSKSTSKAEMLIAHMMSLLKQICIKCYMFCLLMILLDFLHIVLDMC